MCVPNAGHAQDLSPSERGKLDGAFQVLLDRDANAKTGANDISPPSLSTATITAGGSPQYSVIVHTDDPAALRAVGVTPHSVLDDFVTAHVTRNQLRALAQTAEVTQVEASTRLQTHNDEAAQEVGARTLNEGAINNTNYKGQGVISCVIDTGIDYDHGDFANADGTTRLLRIWDQPDTDDSTDTGHPDGFTYGAEYTRSEINADNVSQEDGVGHGTHVAGTMASSGNALVLDDTQDNPEHRGMAPQSDLIMVKTTFGTGDLIDAMNYCDQVAADQNKPVVLNMSLGGHAAPHDGTSTLAQAVDAVTGAGTIAVAAAGNEGSRPIHTSSSVGTGDTSTEPWTVETYTPSSGKENDLFVTTFWIDGTNDLEITVTSPSPDEKSFTLNASGLSTASEGIDTDDGAIFIESDVSADNGDRYVDISVFDSMDGQEPAEGTWTIDMTNNGNSPTTYHGWTYFSTLPGNFDDGNNRYSVGTPATADDAIATGAYVHRWRWSDIDDNNRAYDGSADGRDDIAAFSSRGPLRDDSQKPEITAPGQGIISARSDGADGYIMPGGKHRLSKGTSMSSPIVAGSIALLLQEDESLTPSEIEQLLRDNATVDNFVQNYGTPPNTTFGAGKLNVLEAMTDLLGGTGSRELLSYEDPWDFDTNGSKTVGGSGADKVSLRFTPTQDGIVTGVLFTLGEAPAYTLSDSLNVEVWSDDGSGAPGTKLSATHTVKVAPTQLKDFSPTAVNLLPASANVTAGEDYHLVLYPDNNTETINIGYETAGSANGRSQTYDGSSWSGLGNDFIIRPEIARTGDVSGILPVEIAAFSGVTDGTEATLTWSTASETNNAGFRLQHKVPGDSSFGRAAFVEGSGTTSRTRTYRHTLGDLAPGTHTFRLRQVDTDGTVHTGPATSVTVKMTATHSVTDVRPNPVRETGTVKVTVQESQPVRAAVYNVLGQQVSRLHDGPMAAQEPTTLTLGSDLSSGVYFLRVRGESFSSTKKFVRVR